VWEWCMDWYVGAGYPSGYPSSLANPTGPTSGSTRVLRSGDWHYDENECRVSRRTYNTPTGWTTYGGGFRCARTLK